MGKLISEQTLTPEEILQNLMTNHGTKLLHLAYWYVKDRPLAEDMVQEAFIKALTNIKSGKFHWQSDPYTWIYRVTVNLCRDYLKGASYRRLVFRGDESFGQERGNSAEDEYMKDDESKNILLQVYKLPLIYREVIMLHYYHNLKVKDIARVLQSNEGTIKTRLKRGRENLRLALERSEKRETKK